MPSSPKSSRPTPPLLALVILWLGSLVACHWLAPKLVLDGFDNRSVAWINSRIDNHRRAGEAYGEVRNREWYEAWATSYSWKATALATLLMGGIGAFVASPRLTTRFRRFLFAPTAPLNLGVLRVAVFGMLLLLLLTEPIREFAAWDRANYQWPSVGGAILQRLPISVELVDALLPIAVGATLLAMVGCLSRSSALASCILAFYLLGIPQCSGKVNHTMHHVWMIALVMAFCRCGDAFSVDSLWRAIRRGGEGEVRHLPCLVRYGLPVRVAMLLLASCYFFPGFWKIASNGTQWIFSDNLRNQLLHKWFELETFVPPLPLYDLPGFTTMGALTSVLFEIGFPLALLWRPSRIVWAGLGLLFHNMTRLLMNISFATMQVLYVMFVDWQKLLSWLDARIFGSRLFILYDGNCSLCRRTISLLLALDWLQALRPINALDELEVTRRGLAHLDPVSLLVDMHTAQRLDDGQWHTAKGYDAYRQIARRIPLLWPLLPVLHLPPVAAAGRAIYRRVADSRSCQVTPPGPSLIGSSSLRWSARPLLVVAALLLLAQVVLGMGRIRTAWPVACYPLFDTLTTSTILWPEFEGSGPGDETILLDDDPLRDHYTESRYVPAMKRFVATPLDPQEVRPLLSEFVKVWQDAGLIGTSPPERLAVYIATYELTGPQRPERPSSRKLVAEYSWQELIE